MEEKFPIRFKSFDEVRSRAQWSDGVDPKQHRLKSIIGDYSFSKADEVQCGLSNCRTKHQNGLVVSTEDGIETHIGSYCGRRYFPDEWDKIHARYHRDAQDRDREEFIQSQLLTRERELARTRGCIEKLSEIEEKVAAILKELKREPGVWGAFMAVVRAGGQVRVERRVDAVTAEAMGLSSAQRTTLENVGKVSGLDVVGDPQGPDSGVKRMLSELRVSVVPELKKLSASSLSNLKKRQRADLARRLGAVKDTIARAERLILNAQAFLSVDSLQAIGAMDVPRPSGRATRILNRFQRGEIG